MIYLDFTATPHPTMRHFTRDAPSRGLGQTTLIIIIVVSASVGGLLLTVFFWHILSRFLRPESAPLPPRQALVHQRELQLAAFAEQKIASTPQTLTEADSAHIHQGSDSALLPNVTVGDSSPNASNRVSYIHETDQATLDSSFGSELHPPSPHFFPPRTPHSASSSSSLPSSSENSPPSSGAATPPITFSTSAFPSQSSRRAMNRLGPQPRPLSVVSTNTIRSVSRQSIRAAPHAPHSNVQIVLPAPLAPDLYGKTTGDGTRVQRTFARSSTHSDTWRRSLADSWISVGQDSLPDPKPMELQYSRVSIERPTRLMRSMFVALSKIFIPNVFILKGLSSPGPPPLRSRSFPSSLSRLRPVSALDQLPEGTYPPAPHVPSEFGTLS